MGAFDAGNARRTGITVFFPRSHWSCRPSTMVGSPQATELSVDASRLPFETVTVYQPSGAQVIRTLNLNLKVSSALCYRIVRRMTPTEDRQASM